MPQEALSYDSICMLIGRLILQNQLQLEQVGKSVSEVQQRYNDQQQEVVHLRAEIARLRSQLNDTSGTREAHP